MNKKRFALCFALLYFCPPAIVFSQTFEKPVSRQLIVKLRSQNISAAHLQKESDQKTYLLSKPALDKISVSSLNIPARTVDLKKHTVSLAGRFKNLFIVTLPAGTRPSSLDEALKSYQNDPNVEYASINHIFQTDDFNPNDTYVDSMYWIPLLQASKAWDIQKGAPNVIIGIVDSGIDYDHPDLSGRLWQNPGETGLDGQGNDKRFNGIDDDGNGFADDWRGWDFVDAPEFDDGGDFLTQDNDPLDENGHGTAVAGIVAAQGNNHEGVVGLAFGCTMMNLRAGGASGFLKEDNIAQAVIYAVDNGAKVLNMSFGDASYSPFLKDAIRYAYENNCVIVGSAGNSGSTAYHYPSSFDEVISVSATDAGDFIAPFSNYGASISVAAPGVNVYTTLLGGGYQFFSGTSASAPLVSALAALILSQNSSLTHDEVQSVIESSSDDIGETGWEPFYGAGRINAWRALQVQYASVAKIDFPATDNGTSTDQITIRGTASGALLKNYSVYYGIGSNPQNWMLINTVPDRQIVHDSLSVLNIQPFAEGPYIVRLMVENKDGSAVEDRTRFFVDRSAPQMSAVKIEKMISDNSYGYFVKFTTDDLCASTLYYRPQSSVQNFIPIPIAFQSKNHALFISENELRGQFEFYLEVKNTAKVMTVDNNQNNYYQMDLEDTDIPANTLVQDTSIHLPLFYLMDQATDLNQNGRKELVVNALTANHDFSTVKIYEYNIAFPGKFQPIHSYAFNGVPRDAIGNGFDGKSKLLVGAGASTTVLENAKTDTVPTELIFSDSDDLWGSKFADLFNNGGLEMIAKHGLQYLVLERIASGWKPTNLPNPTSGANLIAIPGSAVGDFDNDGQMEILLGDYDGDLYIYEAQGQNFVPTWSYALPNFDASGFVASGDFDGDGVDEFVAGCHTLDLTSESGAADQYWTFTIFKSTGNNAYQPVWQQSFYGYHSVNDFRSGVSAGDLYNDGRKEIFLSLYPNAYVIRYDTASQAYLPVWFYPHARSNAVVVEDFNTDGAKEIYFNDGLQTSSFKLNGASTSVQPPTAFQAVPLDTDRIALSWQFNNSVDYYKVYRGTDDSNLIFVYNVTSLQEDTTDQNVTFNQSYFYAMSAVKGGIESDITAVKKAKPNRKPFVSSAAVLNASQIAVRFSENMDVNSLEQTSSYTVDPVGHPSSAIPRAFGMEVILTFPGLSPGNYSVKADLLFDGDGTPVDTAGNSAIFTVTATAAKFYILRNAYLGNNQIDLYFSEALQKSTAELPVNYSVEPDFQVTEAALDPVNPNLVHLKVQGIHPIGALGIPYIISARNLISQAGNLLDEIYGNKSALVFSMNDLNRVFVYPNPYRGDESSTLTFANLTPTAKIKIYSLNGAFINEIEETNQDGGVTWDLRDRQGNKISSGIYIYVVESGKMKKHGKFSVVR